MSSNEKIKQWYKYSLSREGPPPKKKTQQMYSPSHTGEKNSARALTMEFSNGKKGRERTKSLLLLPFIYSTQTYWLSVMYWCGLQPVGSICCGCNKQIHMDCRSPVEKRDSMATLWVREYTDPCPDRLLLLSGSITSKKVLIHYAQVCFRWLLFTDNKENDVANAREKNGWSGYTLSLGGLVQTLGSYFKNIH